MPESVMDEWADLPKMIWSITFMFNGARAEMSVRVSIISASLGAGEPFG